MSAPVLNSVVSTGLSLPLPEIGLTTHPPYVTRSNATSVVGTMTAGIVKKTAAWGIGAGHARL
jgi:hypothetical protein